MTEPSSASTPAPSATISLDSAPSGTGLAQVLVGLDLEWVADDLAAIVLERVPTSAGSAPIQLRVVTDLGVLDDIAALRRFDEQLRALRRDLDSFCAAIAAGATTPDGSDASPGTTANGALRGSAGDDERQAVVERGELASPVAVAQSALGSAAGIAGDLAGPAVSAVAQLIDGHLQFAGAPVAPSGAGLDLLFAHALARANPAPRQVVVDRLQPASIGRVHRALDALLAAATGPLARSVQAADAAAGRARALADADQGLIAALDQQILKLTDPSGEPSSLAGLRAQRAALADARPGRLAAVEATSVRADAGRAITSAVSAFATSALRSGPAGSAAPITRAAHGDTLQQPGLLLCYARVLAAGVDEVTGGTLLSTKWGTLAGASVEYAIFDANGATWAAGVRSVLQAAASRGHGNLSTLDRQRVYPPIERGPAAP